MVQEIVAWLIISIAFGILILKILRFFNLVGKKKVNSSQCGGCSSGCEMKEIHKLEKHKLNYDQYRIYL